jgi:5-methylcytosine-specific restriction endonuclease McrBC regulatory subunit McrC
MRALASRGLVRGYQEQDSESRFLRGKLRAREQIHDAARGRTPDLFRILDDAFELDKPWNRIPKAVASSLLTQPGLPPSIREQLSAALSQFAAVPDTPITEADFAAAEAEPRAAEYRDATSVCRLIREGFGSFAPEGGHPAFLVDLGKTFERYVAQRVRSAFADRAAWTVEVQPRFPVGGLDLQPDLLVRHRGKARIVLDTKWKTPRPDPADVQQVLAYAAVTGARHAVLAYPGRSLAVRRLGSVGGGIRLSLIRFPTVGSDTLISTRLAKRLVNLR